MHSERQMEWDKVGPGEQILQRHRFGIAMYQLMFQGIRIINNDAHPERSRPSSDLLSDPAKADDAERLAIQFNAVKFFFSPLTLLHSRIRARDVTSQCQ